MLTLITGTPGAGKSLYAVWNFAKPVPGSTIEDKQQSVERTLYSNVKDLLVEHIKIGPEELNTWHQWAKPGDVILFDEVQEVWRPRSFGTKVPEPIAGLETHRHMGVDFILITQHPMLLDPNIRRLVNQHLHLRRITKTTAMVYEWDHCENPGNTKTAVGSKVWFHPKKAYELYKSAQLHTKPTARMPMIAWLGVLALAGFAYAGPVAYDRFKTSLGHHEKKIETAQAPNVKTITLENGQSATVETVQLPIPAPLPVEPASAPVAHPAIAGCIKVGQRCGCMDTSGRTVEAVPGYCPDLVGSERKTVTFPDSPTVKAPSEEELDAVRFAFLKSNGGPP